MLALGVLGGVALGFLGGYFVQSWVGHHGESGVMSEPDAAALEQAYQEGYNAARERLQALELIPTDRDLETNSLDGVVTEVSGQKVMIEVAPLDPLSDTQIYTVHVSTDTELETKELLPAAEYGQLMEAYMQELEAAGSEVADIPVPDDAVYSPLALSDLRVGDSVVVETEQTFQRGAIDTIEATRLSVVVSPPAEDF